MKSYLLDEQLRKFKIRTIQIARAPEEIERE